MATFDIFYTDIRYFHIVTPLTSTTHVHCCSNILIAYSVRQNLCTSTSSGHLHSSQNEYTISRSNSNCIINKVLQIIVFH